MQRFLILLLLFPASAVFAQVPARWVIDPVHSQVTFSVSHLKIADISGRFKTYNATILASKPDFTDADIQFNIDVSSLSTDNEMRDNHLKSDDFFNAENYPEITFTGKGLKKVNGNKFILTGDLTIRNVTKTVTLDVTYSGTIDDPWGNTKAGFRIEGVINRFDFDLKWNNMTDTGTAVAGAEVYLVINLELALIK